MVEFTTQFCNETVLYKNGTFFLLADDLVFRPCSLGCLINIKEPILTVRAFTTEIHHDKQCMICYDDVEQCWCVNYFRILLHAQTEEDFLKKLKETTTFEKFKSMSDLEQFIYTSVSPAHATELFKYISENKPNSEIITHKHGSATIAYDNNDKLFYVTDENGNTSVAGNDILLELLTGMSFEWYESEFGDYLFGRAIDNSAYVVIYSVAFANLIETLNRQLSYVYLSQLYSNVYPYDPELTAAEAIKKYHVKRVDDQAEMIKMFNAMKIKV